MKVGGLGCRYCAFLLTHLRSAISLVSVLKCWRTRDYVYFGMFPTLSGCCVFAWYRKAFAYENCVNIWKVVICSGDCCALLKRFRILFWAHVSGKPSYISVGKVNSVRWCKLNADREDCLCDRQIVGSDSICKLQWGDSFKIFCFLWTPSCVMAQMWRDRM